MEIQLTGDKTDVTKLLIFSMLDILGEVGIPLNGTPRRLEKMAMACLAVGDIKTKFAEAKFSPQEKSSHTKMQIMVKTSLQVRMMIFVEKICFFPCKPELC